MNIRKFLNDHVNEWKEYEFEGKAFESLGYKTELRPSQYIEFANTDLETSYHHSRINALANAKRAVDCQVDNLISAFGLKKSRHFPQRIEDISSLGLVAPRIIRKVVKLRNKLEHEYYNPTEEEVEDSIDIAHLFVSATTWPIGNFMTAFFVAKKGSENIGDDSKIVDEVLNRDYRIRGYTFTESVFVEFCHTEKCFHIDFISNNSAVVEIEIDYRHILYKGLMAFVLANNHDHPEWDEEKSANAFVKWLNDSADNL